MTEFRCPVCGETLTRGERTLFCPRGHSFDLARQNYVNLLRSNASSQKRHGDDRSMVGARQAFLDGGWYAGLQSAVSRLSVQYASPSPVVLDVGCGEGYYTAAVAEALAAAGKPCEVFGVDISKAALCAAHRRSGKLRLAVASVSALPMPDGACDLLLNLFAPHSDAEFFRVLAPGGICLKAMPNRDHLFELKEAVYDRARPGDDPDYRPEGFTLLTCETVRERLTVAPREQIRNLFQMTPYYYKTGIEDQKKLEKLDSLSVTMDVSVMIFRKNP